MRLPVIRGLIDRRILVNYRVDPACLARILPAPFEPQLAGGWGMAGICLIRLAHLRPAGLPAWLGVGSENAAHRIAVQWPEDGGLRTGVYVARRDTSSRFNVLAGGRWFPGLHHLARFEVNEPGDAVHIGVTSRDGKVRIVVDGDGADALSDGSVFDSLESASAFFEGGALGYSPRRDGTMEGLELRCRDWRVRPMRIERVESSFFDDEAVFPTGRVEFDCAVLMRGIEHEWHQRESMRGGCCEPDRLSAA